MADPSALLPVDEALRRVLAAARPLPSETVPIAQANRRTLAAPLASLRTQPPFNASAMDGYAVRGADVASAGARLRVIGTSSAGHAYSGAVGAGEAVRIFTGAPVPAGADTVLIQESAERDGDDVVVRVPERAGRHVRLAGLDFAEGDVLLPAGLRLDPRSVALAAATNHAEVPVSRRPLVAVLATGDELVRPGEPAGPDQIVASNSFAIAGLSEAAGASVLDLGIASDDFGSLESAIAAAEQAGADVLVTLGGASVGDHDLVQSALTQRGMQLGFWRIAMRPGKPLIFGRLGDMIILGLPGNPVSSMVCGALFLAPLLRALAGDPDAGADRSEPAVLGVALPGNDGRQDYLRARLTPSREGLPTVEPFDIQDSSMLRVMAQADALLIRPPHAPPASPGDICRVIHL
ncbi:molybdopterin molybdotransferase MoeA [Alsobacter sp. SYSU M60028]|uniref:Molybdopterin molybdenumtransferase n=1 Tax=Alsobacter ponti TaxID=2962936 RepID=A0ABT1L9N7_9HYPH|nr:gephyrin-like molybdotransferase Glp [Alsobacter ponti]MCP8938200.1 molybdopterin molybdotransferase MoeA [Alsobacter ponti]